ncbi:MAG: DUF4338 domain-containing protein [Candidatus Synoicihabitans palmerolidicus]|nr:DUF4338 domain-containing protein [Candidatus Synoicihabitans palmerolidicus]
MALLAWGPACYALKDRDRWVGRDATRRVERLSLVVQNRRFLLLTKRGEEPKFASQVLAAAVRTLPGHWQERFGYRPLLAETFTDPEAYQGTCYKASAWEPVGTSQGYERHRGDFYREHGKPIAPVAAAAPAPLGQGPAERPRPRFARGLAGRDCAARPPPPCRSKTASCPLCWRPCAAVPDPRAKNTRFKIGPVLGLVALALLAGRRDIASIARMANLLDQDQRFALALPREVGKKVRLAPSYSVFYDVLTRLVSGGLCPGPHNRWLTAHAGALAGKFIRDAVGVRSLVEADTGAPVALAIVDHKENTPRSEQARAR